MAATSGESGSSKANPDRKEPRPSGALQMNFSESNRLRAISHALIPGGAHTYAKGDDQFPVESPGFMVRGKGCHAWDVDGNEFIEYGMGLRTITLGHGYEPVVRAAYEQMLLGANYTRPAKIEVELAEDLLAILDNFEMIKFAKNGSDVTTAAVKLARAYTGRDLVAYCQDHPFFAVDDWFIGKTEMNAGIPKAIQQLTVGFRYNNIASVKEMFAQYPGQIACLILEAATTEEPKDGFLQQLKQCCEDNGALLIFDEMITGFRWHLGGAQKVYGVKPDMATFGKALANGFALSALVGKREIMRLGGLDHDRERVFLLSTTHAAETHALAAAREVLRVYQRLNVIEGLYRQGERLRKGVNQVISSVGVTGYFEVLGRPCSLIFATKDQTGARSQPFRTLFLQEIIKRGVIGPSFIISFAHSDEDVDRTIDVVHGALQVYRKALDEGVEKYLVGRPVKPVNRRFN